MSLATLFPPMVDDDEDVPGDSSTDEEEDTGLSVRKKKKVAGASKEFAADFVWEEGGRTEDDDEKAIGKYLKKSVRSTLEEKIADERRRRNTSARIEVEGENDENKDEQAKPAKHEDDVDQLHTASDRLREKTKQTGKKKKKADDAFFDEKLSKAIADDDEEITFEQMNLSRPILKAIGAAGFVEPTPIQRACVPVALTGRDICACAATGTGKTAAFVLPIVERLLFKPKNQPVTRVLVLLPTRELAIQVFQVFRKLSQFSQLDICLCAGGLDLKAQEAALRSNPDVVIATPGRLIDHLHNAPSFSLASIEVLVLDEADRMLEEAFKEQMTELIRLCARNRQTLLFSATMTDQIDELASMTLKKPVRIFVNENTDTALRLRQEFIRIRAQRESDREPIVAALVTRTFMEQTIVFVRTKKDCQRLQILLGLLGVKVGQLHGSLTQSQRIEALAKFKRRELDVLCSTDLASRGLDIEGVATVINMNMPMTLKQYVHRVGRTARAGKAGRSISLVGEDDRKLLKEIVNANPDRSLKQRTVAPEVIDAYSTRVKELEESIKNIEEAEKSERAMRIAEQDLAKTEQKLETGKTEREGRQWMKTPTELERLEKKKKREAALKAKAKQRAPKSAEDTKLDRLADFQVREAKRARRTKRMRAVVDEDKSKKGKAGGNRKRKHSVFTDALTNVGGKSVKKFRHGPDDKDFKAAKLKRMKKGGGKKH